MPNLKLQSQQEVDVIGPFQTIETVLEREVLIFQVHIRDELSYVGGISTSGEFFIFSYKRNRHHIHARGSSKETSAIFLKSNVLSRTPLGNTHWSHRHQLDHARHVI